MEATKQLNPIRIPGSNALCWVSAHEHLIASYTDDGRWVLIVLKSGHHLYGYYTEAAWINYECPDVYPEDHTPEYWSEELAGVDEWTAAIKDIPALYAYYEPY
jgi:hypothetical protein